MHVIDAIKDSISGNEARYDTQPYCSACSANTAPARPRRSPPHTSARKRARRRRKRIRITLQRHSQSPPPLHQRIAFVGKHHRADLTRSMRQCQPSARPNSTSPVGLQGEFTHTALTPGTLLPRRNIRHVVDLKHLAPQPTACRSHTSGTKPSAAPQHHPHRNAVATPSTQHPLWSRR